MKSSRRKQSRPDRQSSSSLMKRDDCRINECIRDVAAALPTSVPRGKVGRRFDASRPVTIHIYPAGGTIPYEKNQHLLVVSRCASARLASLPSLQRTQSLVRKCSAGPEHWIPLCPLDYAGGSAGGLCSHRVWWSVCFIFRGAHQRDGAKHPGRKQHAVAGHDHYRRDFRSWNSQCDGQHSKWELGRFGLFQRRNQQRAHLDYYLARGPL